MILALAAAVFAACDKSDEERQQEQTLCPIARISQVSYSADQEGGPFSKYFEVMMEPNFDAQGRLSGIIRRSWGMTVEETDSADIYHYLKDFEETVDVIYNPDHTGKLVYKGQTYSHKFIGGVPVATSDTFDIEIPLVFNNDWCITRAGESSYEYEYADGYWKDGDMITWQDGDMMTCGQYSFTYSDEANPFKDWIDFTPGMISLPEEYSFGLMGKRSAHIPATIYDEDSMIPTTTVSVTKDKQGRITQLRYDREGEENIAYSTLEIQYK